MSTGSIAHAAGLRSRPRIGVIARRALGGRPELGAVLALTAVLNLWGLGANGWANTYYSAAVRSMSSSWHNFLFASMDPAGLMTVDKPPFSLWVQALSARLFGLHPLSVLVPQALMGVVAVALIYDLTRRRFGRTAGFVAGLALATTPIVVAVSRHNNPDELLALCSVAALWFAVRGLEDGRARWIVLSGLCVGLGFETKMGVALMVVPGIAAAWMWVAPRGRLVALRELAGGGATAVLAGGAWPLLVTLTPAADRPWISGTSDNSIWSLIFGYNGLGRIAGQSGGPPGPTGGGPGGAGGALFGGPTGPLRLLESGLGDQAGWLLGLAVAAGLAILIRTRLKRDDPRTGWLIAVGGALLTTGVAFSYASGIFHPYYVSLLAPFAAALIGAGAGQMLGSGKAARLTAPLVICAGLASELYVLGGLNGALAWATPLVIAVAGACAVGLALTRTARVRYALTAAAFAALLAAPGAWAVETLGHPASGTFPAGGPAGADAAGIRGPGAGLAARAGGRTAGAFGGIPAAPTAGIGGPPAPRGLIAGLPGANRPFRGPGASPFGAPGASPSGAPGGPFGGRDSSLTAAIRFARTHGGGTIGVSSQSSAAAAVVSSGGNVAGLGGFSGRESSVTPAWLAAEVRAGRLRWILADQIAGPRLPGDTRAGSQSAISIAQRACRAVTVADAGGASITMYDCQGRAAAIVAAARAR